MELTVLRHAWIGIRTCFAPPPGAAATYVEKNMLGILGLVLLVGAVPEIPLHHLLLARHAWWISLLLDVIVLYSAAWVLGMYGIMAMRPHELNGEKLLFHRGLLAQAEVPLSNIRSVTPLSNPDGRALRRLHRNGYLGLPGSDLVHLRLSEPARIVKLYPLRKVVESQDLLVATDRPNELCAMCTKTAVSRIPRPA